MTKAFLKKRYILAIFESGLFLKSYLLLVFSLVLFQCISFQKGKSLTLAESSENFAIYELESPEEGRPDQEIQSQTIQEKDLFEIFHSLKKDASLSLSVQKESVYKTDSIKEFAPYAVKILNRYKNLKPIFIVFKEEDKLSPYTRIFRNNLYMYRNENELHIVFGEIGNNINFVTPYSFNDWAGPLLFTPECEKSPRFSIEGKRERSIRYHIEPACKTESNKDFSHIIALLDESGLSPEEEKGDPSIRLQKLQELYKKGLINKKEYDKKKAEIIKEL